MRAACVLVWLVAGCFQSASTTCSDGTVCPPGRVCADGPNRCVLPEQRTACEFAADGDACTFVGASGTCQDGVCLPTGCGDGTGNGDEVCDGADLRGGDCSTFGFHGGGTLACTADCTYDTSGCLGGICGDAEVNGDEACEPGVTPAADCRDFDFYDAGAAVCNAGCRFDVSSCKGFCGDGELNGLESCEENVSLLERCVSYAFNYGWTECRACVPVIGDCHYFGWHPATVETAGAVRAIHGTGASDVWVAGDGGLLLRSAGTRFVAITPSVSENFRAVWALASDDVFLASAGGTIQRWNGTAWSVTFSDVAWSFDALWSAGPGHLLAAGSQGLLSWNGTVWTALATPANSQAPVKLWGTAADDYYVIDANEDLYRFQVGTWTKQNLVGVRAIGGRASNDVYVALANLTAQRYQGTTWQPLTITFPDSPRAVVADATGVHFIGDDNLDYHFDGTLYWGVLTYPTLGLGDLVAAWSPGLGQVFAGGPNGLFSYDGSIQFVDGYSGGVPPVPVTGLWFATPTLGFAAATNIYQYGGAQYTVAQANTNSRAVWGAASNAVFAVGDAGSIWRFSGASWQKMNEPMSTPTLFAVHGTSGSDVWAVGVGGSIVHYNGTLWSTVTSNTTSDLLGVWAASAADAVAVGSDGTIVRWNGASWSVVTPVTTKHLRAVWGSSSSDIVAVGDTGTVLRWNGTAWNAVPSGTSLTLRGVWGTAPDDVFIVGDLVSVFHDDGYGITPVKLVGSLSATSFWSVSGVGRTVHFGGQGNAYAGMQIQRTTPWKRRSPP